MGKQFVCVFMLPKLQGRKNSQVKSGLRKVNNLGCVSCDNEINHWSPGTGWFCCNKTSHNVVKFKQIELWTWQILSYDHLHIKLFIRKALYMANYFVSIWYVLYHWKLKATFIWLSELKLWASKRSIYSNKL